MREAYLATPAQIAAARRAFYALCTHIDHQLSVIVGTLREEALLDDTVICFTSDHGDMLGNHGLWAKQLFYEPSANVPLLLVGADSAEPPVETGVDGLDVLFGTSSLLRQFSHGRDIGEIIESATEVIEFIKGHGLEVRFSSEDSFRSDLVDLLTIYREVDKVGVSRVGIADSVGVADPLRVHEVVRTLRGIVSCNIEFHGHNDTGCAVANAYAALAAGATHVDASVLGIGERNGITPLGGFLARMYAHDPDLVRTRYRLPVLRRVENLVADLVGIDVPFNNYITGYAAFMHKAGIHAKAMLNNPSTYEILDPGDFGMDRYIHVAHRLTGWNAIKHRAQQLQVDLSDDQIRRLTARIKRMADDKPLSLDDVDALLRAGQDSVDEQ
jgi:homocitrate synthase